MSEWLHSLRVVWAGIVSLAGLVALVAVVGCATTQHQRHAVAVGPDNHLETVATPGIHTNASTNPAPAQLSDNTAQNKRDAHADTLTPMDQGNSSVDRRITQQLRRAIITGKGGRRFSFLAKNVKIITVHREVTLRGVVADDAERAAIQALAQEVPAVDRVNNQLAVKVPKGTAG